MANAVATTETPLINVWEFMAVLRSFHPLPRRLGPGEGRDRAACSLFFDRDFDRSGTILGLVPVGVLQLCWAYAWRQSWSAISPFPFPVSQRLCLSSHPGAVMHGSIGCTCGPFYGCVEHRKRTAGLVSLLFRGGRNRRGAAWVAVRGAGA